MREVIKSLISLVDDWEVTPVFENANKQFDTQNIRIFANEILLWLRSDLFVPRKKAIRYPNTPEWFSNFSLFIQNTNELSELFVCENYSLNFQPEILFDEQMEIHKYVIENSEPPVFRRTFR